MCLTVSMEAWSIMRAVAELNVFMFLLRASVPCKLHTGMAFTDVQGAVTKPVLT